MDTAFYYVLFIQVVPPGYLLALTLLSCWSMRSAQRDEPTAAGEEAIPLDHAADSGSPDTNELTRLNNSSKAVLQNVGASDFVDAILSNIDYGINAEQLAARAAAQAGQRPAAAPAPAVQPAQSGAAGVFGGLVSGFNKVISSTVSAVQTVAESAANTLTFSDKPKEVEQEEIIWALEFTGKRVDGGPWRKTFKVVWIQTIIAVGVRTSIQFPKPILTPFRTDFVGLFDFE